MNADNLKRFNITDDVCALDFGEFYHLAELATTNLSLLRWLWTPGAPAISL